MAKGQKQNIQFIEGNMDQTTTITIHQEEIILKMSKILTLENKHTKGYK